jgi:hypothetical protein
MLNPINNKKYPLTGRSGGILFIDTLSLYGFSRQLEGHKIPTKLLILWIQEPGHFAYPLV